MQDKYRGKISTLHLLEGARQARGLAVIIDVFRAFSLECYFYSSGAKLVRPVGSLEEAYSMKQQVSGCLLAGERKGRKCEGFDYGNSPSSIDKNDLEGKIIVHTTSAGTQGIVNAGGADILLTGSLVNAKAIARYIIRVEDELGAEYIRSLLLGEDFPDMEQRIRHMIDHGAEKFFTPELQDVFPEQDVWLCTMCDRFDFVLKGEKDEIGYVSRKIDV